MMMRKFMLGTVLVAAGVGIACSSSNDAPAPGVGAGVDAGGSSDDDSGRVAADAAPGTGFAPTKLPIDCRTPENRPHDGMNPDVRCEQYQEGPALGTGPSVKQIGPSYHSGYYDKGTDSFLVAARNAIMKISRKTGDRTILSGGYNDPATGKKMAGTGPSWEENGLVYLRAKKDGKIFVMGSDGFYLVDPATGARTKHRDLAGVPAPNMIRAEGGFAVDADDNIIVVLTRKNAGGGVGLLRFKSGGVGEVITLSGAIDTSRNKGAGIDYDVAGYAAVQVVKSKIYMLNGDDNNLTSVDPVSGDRTVVSGKGVGKDTDDNSHSIAGPGAGQTLFIDEEHNVAYANRTRIDLANGARSYWSPLIRDVIEPQDPSNAFGNLGIPIHLEYPFLFDVVEDTTAGGSVRWLEPETGNFNYLSRE